MFSIYSVQLFTGGAICPPVVLDYVVPSKAVDLWYSPAGVADSLQQSWVQSGWGAGRLSPSDTGLLLYRIQFSLFCSLLIFPR
jgi:hypothetical protein